MGIKSNDELYQRLAWIAEQLRAAGQVRPADRIELLLRVTWTTTTELFAELETSLKALVEEGGASSQPGPVREQILECLDVLQRASQRASAKDVTDYKNRSGH